MSIIIKNNIVVEDARLDRVTEFDEKSRLYSIGDIRKTNKLRSYTWRCNEWFNQGKEGACVGFALGHELAARPAEVKGLNYKYLIEKVYWEAQKKDPWPGGSYPNAEPFYSGTSVLAGVKRIKELGYIDEYRWAFNIEDVLYGIGHNGPAVLGLPWYEGMRETNRAGYIKASGKLLGGHAVLARSVNIKKGRVTFRNSWGKTWGKRGDCHITFKDLELLLKQGGECCFLMKRKTNKTKNKKC